MEVDAGPHPNPWFGCGLRSSGSGAVCDSSFRAEPRNVVLGWSRLVSRRLWRNVCVCVCVRLLVSAGFAVLCWFCDVLCWSLSVSLFCAGFVLVSAGLCWSLPVSLFCAGFVLVSPGLCRFRCFVLVLCWSLPVSLFCAGFVLVSAGLCRFRCFVLVLRWSHRKRFNSFQDTLLESQKDIYISRCPGCSSTTPQSTNSLDHQLRPQLVNSTSKTHVPLKMPIQLSAADVNLQAEGHERFHDVAWALHTRR
jgi:hypothetical protein